MHRQILAGLALLLLLPAFAHAWYVNAKTTPLAGQGTITPTGTKYYATEVDSGEYAVSPAPGYYLSRVTIDGIPAAPNANGNFIVPYLAGKTYRYIVAYFTSISPVNYTISLSTGAHGTILEDTSESLTGIPAGATRTLIITPEAGYQISSIIASNATPAENPDGTQTVTYADISADQTVSATFSVIPVVVADAGSDVITNGPGAANPGYLDAGQSTSNVGAISYSWSGTGLVITADPENPAKASVYADAPGEYEATLTIVSGGITATDTAKVTVKSVLQITEEYCLACHDGRNPGLGDAYDLSTHKLTTHFPGGVTCRACHDPAATSSSAHYTDNAPYGAGTYEECQSCHTPGGDFSIYEADLNIDRPDKLDVDGITILKQFPHGSGTFGSRAQYVANGVACSDCHGSHDNTLNIEYAESGHGDIFGAAWVNSASHDWPNAAGCKDCHSTYGFAVKMGATDLPAPAIQGPGQTLACNACHSDVGTGALRATAPVTVAYKSQTVSSGIWTLAPATFPNATQSNTCINCHSGRESGESIKALADTSMSNTSFKNPHYIGAAGMMYAKLGYNFAGQDTIIPGTTNSYGLSLTANEDGGALTSTHRKLGTAAINGDSHNPSFFVPGTLDSDGPCVSCHMADEGDHTWEIGAASFTNVCVKCHDEEAGVPLTVDNYQALFIEEQAVPFEDAIALANTQLLANFNIQYSDAYPYFYDNNLTPAGAVRDWTRGGMLTAAEARHLMGACLNIKLMKADPAAYVHARTYARRLLYDTIDWLDDKTLNLSTGATALASGLTHLDGSLAYVKGALATSPETTESAKYLIKYSRSTGAWDIVSERP